MSGSAGPGSRQHHGYVRAFGAVQSRHGPCSSPGYIMQRFDILLTYTKIGQAYARALRESARQGGTGRVHCHGRSPAGAYMPSGAYHRR